METFSTPLQKYFGNSTIFVIGATGLLGSLLTEKLLRTCTDLKKIYILLRPKKGISSEDRFKLFFDRPIFEKLKSTNPEFLNQVIMVLGDCSQPNLGLNKTDLKNLIKEVNCIFYCAASINFDEQFRLAVTTNVSAVRYLLQIAKLMQDLKSIVYVSTAFFQGFQNKAVVYEEVDETNNKLPEQLETLCENFDDKLLEKFKAMYFNFSVMDKNATIYSTTKWASEILIKKVGEGLPIAVVRPSLITPTLSDPVPGWIDNIYGPIGVYLSISLGFVRVLLLENSYNVDLIPADYVTNCMIASALDIFRQNNNDFSNNEAVKQSTIKIYNCVSSFQNPITNGKALDLTLHYYRSMPSTMQVFYDQLITTSNIVTYYILKYILCIIPIHIIEVSSYCVFKPIKFSGKLKKMFHRFEITFPHALCDWRIRDDNVQSLWKNLNDGDKMLFNFDVTNINWELYCKSLVKGMRIYLLKDPMETVPRALKRRSKLKKIFYSSIVLVIFWVCLIIYYILQWFFF